MALPRIVAFLCDACAYAAADQAGRSRMAHPQSLLTIRVMCTGRIEPAFVLEALREGADGVLVGGCHPGDCRYAAGNVRAAARHTMLVGVLEQLGISRERCRLEWLSSSEAHRLAEVVADMTARLTALGPLRYPRPALPRGLPAEAGAEAAAERAPARPRVALYWSESCGACEQSLVDLAEDLLPALEHVEVMLLPLAGDPSGRALEALADGSVDIGFVLGAVCDEEQARWAGLLRRKSRLLVAYGACAHEGGILGLANLAGGSALPHARPLAVVEEVDYTVPGCPPHPRELLDALRLLLSGDLPPRGAVLAASQPLCDACPRQGTRPRRVALTALRTLESGAPDPDTCLLAQGYACMGTSTRQGCEPGCVSANVPCRGCYGPLDGVPDHGAAALSALASVLAGEEPVVRAMAGGLPDPAGTFYRYGLAAGLLPGRRHGDPACPTKVR